MTSDSDLELKINPERSFVSLKVMAGAFGAIIAGASWCTYIALTVSQLRDGQKDSNGHLVSIEGKMDGDRERIGGLEYRVTALEQKSGTTVGR